MLARRQNIVGEEVDVLKKLVIRGLKSRGVWDGDLPELENCECKETQQASVVESIKNGGVSKLMFVLVC
jgi:hypothetical protein